MAARGLSTRRRFARVGATTATIAVPIVATGAAIAYAGPAIGRGLSEIGAGAGAGAGRAAANIGEGLGAGFQGAAGGVGQGIAGILPILLILGLGYVLLVKAK